MFTKTVPQRFRTVPAEYGRGTVPITPHRLDSVGIKLRYRQRLTTRSSMTIEQLPFVPAYYSTTYKVQGLTASGVVAFPFVKGCRRKPSFAALYVVLSRVRKLQSLFLTEPITMDDLRFFVPPKDLLLEEERLDNLHSKTMRTRSRHEQVTRQRDSLRHKHHVALHMNRRLIPC